MEENLNIPMQQNDQEFINGVLRNNNNNNNNFINIIQNPPNIFNSEHF